MYKARFSIALIVLQIERSSLKHFDQALWWSTLIHTVNLIRKHRHYLSLFEPMLWLYFCWPNKLADELAAICEHRNRNITVRDESATSFISQRYHTCRCSTTTCVSSVCISQSDLMRHQNWLMFHFSPPLPLLVFPDPVIVLFMCDKWGWLSMKAHVCTVITSRRPASLLAFTKLLCSESGMKIPCSFLYILHLFLYVYIRQTLTVTKTNLSTVTETRVWVHVTD